MEATNAFDALILPILQCTAAIFACLAVIRLSQVAFEDRDRIELPVRGETEWDEPKGSVLPFRPSSAHVNPTRSRRLNLSR